MINLEGPLREGKLLLRYKRFLADIELDDGQLITAHCPNSGSMLGMKEPGSRVVVRHVPDPKRKLKWTLELIRPPGMAWVGCNTMRPNHIVAAMIVAGLLPLPSGPIRREVKYGENSRIDLLIESHPACYVEVKNTTLALTAQGDVATGVGPHIASFPDAVTARGTKHMQELTRMAEEGFGAAVVFLINRGDCRSFQVADHIDPAYQAAWQVARDAGVQMIPVAVKVSPGGWKFSGILPIETVIEN